MTIMMKMVLQKSDNENDLFKSKFRDLYSAKGDFETFQVDILSQYEIYNFFVTLYYNIL